MLFSGFGLSALFAVGAGLFGFAVLIVALMYRRVVRPNEVHIVQTSKGTAAYGVGQFQEDEDAERLDNGNSYYEWPTWLPRIGVQVVKLPLSVFDENLDAYEAYDIGKVPFVVDVVAFFRIAQPSVAAKRIESLGELQKQLRSILQGAVRTVLAKHEIEQIMEDRSTFGDLFTALTKDQLAAWGVVNVKNIELMDIRDPRNNTSEVVNNIMAKKKSLIEKESRIEVAQNDRDAKLAEIDAKQVQDVRDQQAAELVGLRTAEKDQKVGIANEQAQQEIKQQAKETMTRDMAVKEVETVRTAEITKAQMIVAAEQDRETKIVIAEGQRQQTVIAAEATKAQTALVAEGFLIEQTKSAEGILAVGTSEAEARRLSETAQIAGQIALAQEIGENEGYQTYLVSIRGVEANEAIGVEQAKALQNAGIKVIATTGSGGVGTGIDSVRQLFTAQGGTAIGAAIEGFSNTPAGAKVLDTLGVDLDDPNAPVAASSRSNGAAA
jgi:flotillin